MVGADGANETVKKVKGVFKPTDEGPQVELPPGVEK